MNFIFLYLRNTETLAKAIFVNGLNEDFYLLIGVKNDAKDWFLPVRVFTHMVSCHHEEDFN